MKSSANTIKQKGFTLIEILVVLGVIAVIGVVVAQNIGGKLDESNVNNLSNEMTEINGAMVKCGAIYRNDYTACTFAELIRLNLLTVAQWGDGTGETPWGGDYTAAVVGGNSARYTIAATGIPEDNYGNLLIELWRETSLAVPTYDGGTTTFTITQGTR